MPDAELQTKAVSQLTQDDEEYENEVEDDEDDDDDEDENGEAATCSALCNLGTSDINAAVSACAAMKKENPHWEEFSTSNSCCPKQLQLPMFLSSTYLLMFPRCHITSPILKMTLSYDTVDESHRSFNIFSY